MPNRTPIPPADAAKFADDIVSRLPPHFAPPHFAPADADRTRLTGNLSRFLSRCVLVDPPALPKDQDSPPAA